MRKTAHTLLVGMFCLSMFTAIPQLLGRLVGLLLPDDPYGPRTYADFHVLGTVVTFALIGAYLIGWFVKQGGEES